MTSFTLKIIALITMFIDHLGYAIFNKFSFFNYIGRVAFPIFAFQISEGFHYTKNVKKYFARLLLFAMFSQIPFMLFLSIFSNNIYKLNVFFTLLLGLFSIYIYDKIINSFYITSNVKLNNFLKFVLGISIVLFIGFIAEFLKSDYGLFGIAVIFLFYLFKNKNYKLRTILYLVFMCLGTFIKYGILYLANSNYMYLILCCCTISPIIFICLYNKQQGHKIKYLLYFFYPIHLLVLYLLHISQFL